MSETQSAVRTINDGPFCWQSKDALDRIREAFDGEDAVASAIAVYVALTEIASDFGRDSFQTTHAWISHKSGVGTRTVFSRLQGLREAGLVVISTPALRSPSNYRLLLFRNGCKTFRNDCETNSNDCGAIRNGPIQPPLQPLEEKERKGKETEKKLLRKAPRESDPVLDALVALDGSDPVDAGRSAFGAAASARKEILESTPSLTVEEIGRRVGNYRLHWPGAACTAKAIAKYWPLCNAPPAAKPTAHREPPTGVVSRNHIAGRFDSLP